MGRWQREKEQVREIAQRLAGRGLVTGTAGNVSLRLEAKGKTELLAITPSGVSYEAMKPDDIVIVSFEGGIVEGTLKPSLETSLHIGVYRARPDLIAVIHTHSTYASALAVAGRDLPPVTEEQVFYLGGAIRCAPFALSGSDELAAGVIEALGDRNAVLLGNHGAIGAGKDAAAALAACELLEATARSYLLALGTGAVGPLPEAAVTHWKAQYDRARAQGS